MRVDGLDVDAFAHSFGHDPFDALPELRQLDELGLADRSADGRVILTPLGMEHSDTIGPWLYSPAVTARMGAYELI